MPLSSRGGSPTPYSVGDDGLSENSDDFAPTITSLQSPPRPRGVLQSLNRVFLAFANYGSANKKEKLQHMDGAKWAKFCRDCGLQNSKTFTAVQVDLAFQKVKTKGERRVDFEEFKDAVAMVAELRGESFAELCELINAKGGPQSNATRAEYVKFADPDNFTGAYAANVGRSSVMRHVPSNWERELKNVKPTPRLKKLFNAHCAFGKGDKDLMNQKTFCKVMKDCNLFDKKFTPTRADIIFTKIKAHGERVVKLDGFTRALQLVAQEKNASYEDLVEHVCACNGPASSGTAALWTKFHDDKSTYTGAYAAIAGASKSTRVHESHDAWKSKRQPPEPVKGLRPVFDAFSAFGGGQPGSMDNVKFAKLCIECGLVDRTFNSTAADIVFQKVKPKGERKITFVDFLWACDRIAEAKQVTYATVTHAIVMTGGPQSSGTKAEYTKFYDDKETFTGAAASIAGLEKAKSTRERKHWKDGRIAPAVNSVPAGLKESYAQFCSFGGGNGQDMNIKVWGKLTNECGLLDRKLNKIGADIIFAKVAEGGKLLSFRDFLWMLVLVAEEKGTTFDEIGGQIARAAPDCSGTKAEYARFHDDKSTYTGQYVSKFGVEKEERKKNEKFGWKAGRSVPRSVPGVEMVFDAFCTFGGGRPGAMSSTTWGKVLEDCELLGPDLTHARGEVLFAKVCGVGAKHVGYVDFKWLLQLTSEAKSFTYMELCEVLLTTGGPKSSGTTSFDRSLTKFHDDRTEADGSKSPPGSPRSKRERGGSMELPIAPNSPGGTSGGFFRRAATARAA